jgi:hypothetical protein
MFELCNTACCSRAPIRAKEMMFDAHDRASTLFQRACGRRIQQQEDAVETVFIGLVDPLAWCFGKTPMQTFLDAMPTTNARKWLPLDNVGHQNQIAQAGNVCQIESRLLRLTGPGPLLRS